MPAGLLDKRTLLLLLNANPPLVDGAVDLATQLQPNGIDLTVRDVARYTSAGAADFSNAKRVVSETKALACRDGALFLEPGPYLVTFNEVVHIPKDVAALGRTRSSLLRSGIALHTAVWDAGYEGRSQSLMTVHNPQGFTLHKDARIMQLVFFRLESPMEQGYVGTYLRENM